MSGLDRHGARPLSERAEQHAEWALTHAAHAGPARTAAECREKARTSASVAESYALRDLAEANRELAESNRVLAASYDAMADELRARRGVPEAA